MFKGQWITTFSVNVIVNISVNIPWNCEDCRDAMTKRVLQNIVSDDSHATNKCDLFELCFLENCLAMTQLLHLTKQSTHYRSNFSLISNNASLSVIDKILAPRFVIWEPLSQTTNFMIKWMSGNLIGGCNILV